MTNTLLRALTLLAVSIGTATAQPATPVHVRVLTTEGKPIWGAQVSMWELSTRTYVGLGYTGENGEAAKAIPAGSYRVGVNAAGFRPGTDTIVVAGTDSINRDLVLASHRATALVGIRFGGPAGVSIAMGPAYLIRPAPGKNAQTETAALAFVFAEPGLHAGKLSAGGMVTKGNYKTTTIRGSLLRRWSSPDDLFVGVELSATLVAVGPRIGLFRRIAGEKRGSLHVFWDFGLGL